MSHRHGIGVWTEQPTNSHMRCWLTIP